ncbi:MAG: PKD domain-containing protein [bacterium]|nr:PKD domain-containing protein [bacterium]
MADAGPEQTVETTSVTTSVTLNGSASTDADGDPLTYTWIDGDANVIGSSHGQEVQLVP